MHIENNEKLKGQIVLIDPYIHKKAKLNKEEFLERVSNVKYLRTTYNSHYISYYITSINEYNNLIKFHQLINQGLFDFDGYHVFAVAIQPKLYNWFKTTDISTIQKQIVSWMASIYYFNIDKRNIYNQQMYQPLIEEINNIIDQYYKDFEVPNFSLLTEQLIENNDETLFKEYNNCKEKYLRVCKLYYDNQPPEFLSSPIEHENLKGWGINNFGNFDFIEAFFNDKDWDRIIIKGDNKDDLHRAESLDGLWLKWKHVYTTFEQRQNYVYSFYYEPNNTNSKSPIKKRETIPQNVKDKVWQRDNGLCVECGSNENLEFDHIIPFSKGGSSTYRNIQLLCEPCNRKKRDKI